MRALSVAVGVLASSPALGCYVLPPELARDHASLVQEAPAIVLLEAVESGKGCALRVVRVLKGNAMDATPVPCRLPADGDWMTDFSSHTETSFWEGAGRLGVDGSCRTIPPAFSVSKFYLVLLGVDPDTKQFEQIGEDDRWLAFVEAQLRAE